MARLIIRYPNNMVKEVDFEATVYKIGASPENDLVLENEGVEPFQAQIETHEGTYSIIDVSENKTTTVNGKKIERSNLNYGDRIALGPVIGLFYPPQKKKIGDKTKLILYVGAGALVILLSIVAIFLFTTRKISSEVITQFGEPIVKEEIIGTSESGKILQEKKPEPEKVKVSETKIEESEGLFTGISNIFRKSQLQLPEPTQQEISTRNAVAVPTGLKKLFFKKIPVKVELALSVSKLEEERVILAPGKSPAESSKPVPEVEGVEEQLAGEELIPPVEEETRKGLFNRIISPVIKIFKKKSEVEEAGIQEPVSETGTIKQEELPVPAEAFSPPEAPPPPETKELLKVQNPLAYLRSIDIKEVISPGLKEEPVYSEREIETFISQNFLGKIEVSKRENINASVIWKYPEAIPGREEKQQAHFIRAGAIGRMNRDKYYDPVFVSDRGNLVALGGDTGTEILIGELGAECYSPVLEDMNGDGQEDIVIVFPDGRISVYDQNFEVLWVYHGKEKITSPPLLADLNRDKIADVVFPLLNMDIVAIDGKTGVEMWRFFDAQSETIFAPSGFDVNEDGVLDVVFITRDGKLYALDGKSGWGLWNIRVFGKPSGGVCIADLDGNGEKDVLTLTLNGVLTGINSQGKILFSLELNDTYNTAPSVGDLDGNGNNDIVLISQSGLVKAFEARTRRGKWSYEIGESTSLGRPSLCDVNLDGNLDVAFSTLSGLILVIDGATGSDVVQFNTGDYIFTNPLVYDINKDKIPELVITTHDGKVFAIQVAGVKKPFFKLKSSFWPAQNYDNLNTGYSKYYILKKSWK